MDDGTDIVRESAAQALGTLMMVVSERVLYPYIEKLDKLKMAKVKEYFNEAQSKSGRPTAQSENATARSAKVASVGSIKKSVAPMKVIRASF